MKISKKQLRQIIKEEAHDCYQDYKAGGLSYEEYQDCLKSFSQDDYGYRPSRRKTSYVGSDANQDKIAAVQAALATKPNNFLKSILSQLERGRGLSGKQKSIVKKILGKVDPEAAALFEIASKSLSPEEVEQGLTDRAKSYHAGPALSKDGPGAIRTLLQDDFMDDYGHEMVMGDFADLIDQLSRDPNSLRETKNMKITKRQLRRIIKEEKAKLAEQMTLGQRGRGLIDNTMAERAKAHLTGLYDGAVNDLIAEEGLTEEEAEEMAVAAVIEVVKEFLDSVGYRHYLEQ